MVQGVGRVISDVLLKVLDHVANIDAQLVRAVELEGVVNRQPVNVVGTGRAGVVTRLAIVRHVLRIGIG